MKKSQCLFLITISLLLFSLKVQSQISDANVASTSDYLSARPLADRSLFFSVNDSGVQKPIIWGLDLAWLSEENIRRGIAFMGVDRVDVVRSSFTPTAPLIDGNLPVEELGRLNERIGIIDKWLGASPIVLNCDHPTVDAWFSGNASRWAQLIDVTTRHHEEAGHTVVTVSPFNEPDYGWGQGSINDFYNIAGELKMNDHFKNIRISGGNTLNADQAVVWYKQLKDRLDEGNTHQLAGSFASYASFFETVRANGHHATNDELHNVMEAMVGAEYGMQTGIWWGTAEYTRGEFVKASDGVRLAYAEHRPNWTAASVYRTPEGKTQAFGGSSERQALTTTFKFISKDKDVFFNGYGPQREYIMEIPGGTGYQQGQTNAEAVVNISYNEDIQPVIDGEYVLVNRNSGKVMEVTAGSTNAGAGVRQATRTGASHQHWNVKPVSSRIGGDFSYFTITASHSGKSLDILNWSLENGGDIIVWDDVKGGNQQWYLEYASDGWFYIRSRHSAKCLQVYNSSTVSGTKIVQWEKNEEENQQWRFLPIDAAVEFDAPEKPVNLSATVNPVSVELNWIASPDADVAGYVILRSETQGKQYSTIARNVKAFSFVDNTVTPGVKYYYKIKATDYSLNASDDSNEVAAIVNGDDCVVAAYDFEENTRDSSLNFNHAAANGEFTYVDGINNSQAIVFDGQTNFLQLSPNIANYNEMSICCWIKWDGGARWQRIFDFGNGQDEYLFLTPRMRFEIMSGGVVQRFDADKLPEGEWVHLALIMSEAELSIFLNGKLLNKSSEISTRPVDIKPVLNYIGRGQNDIPLFDGAIDRFQIFNYPLHADEIVDMYESGLLTSAKIFREAKSVLNIWPVPANNELHVSMNCDSDQLASDIAIYSLSGSKILGFKNKRYPAVIDVSGLSPGAYVLKVNSGEALSSRKIFIKR